MTMSDPASLPPGFRFHPTDEELLLHYLRNQAASLPCPVSIIAEVDIYKFDPWDLPAKAMFGEQEWYFFSPRDRKYPNGVRPNRAAASGYWKATGTDKPIHRSGGKEHIGVKKALVFYKGRPPRGRKTNWIMHEYRLAEAHHGNTYKPMKFKNASMRVISSSHFHLFFAGIRHTESNLPFSSLRLRWQPLCLLACLLACICTPLMSFDVVVVGSILQLDDWVLCRIYKKNHSLQSVPPLVDQEQEDSGSGDIIYLSSFQNTEQPSGLRMQKSFSVSDFLENYSAPPSHLFDNLPEMQGSELALLMAQPSTNQLKADNSNCSNDNYTFAPHKFQEEPAASIAANPTKRQRTTESYLDGMNDLLHPWKKPSSDATIYTTEFSDQFDSTQCNQRFFNQQMLLNPQLGLH
ncbi:hypothetical protein BHM03_00059866 [Ensete ventricosum]|nr:hypothetical protein BHM03_00059866 [Ensete ventricosum]